MSQPCVSAAALVVALGDTDADRRPAGANGELSGTQAAGSTTSARLDKALI